MMCVKIDESYLDTNHLKASVQRVSLDDKWFKLSKDAATMYEQMFEANAGPDDIHTLYFYHVIVIYFHWKLSWDDNACCWGLKDLLPAAKLNPP